MRLNRKLRGKAPAKAGSLLFPYPETFEACGVAVREASDAELLRAQKHLEKHPLGDLAGQELDYLIDHEQHRRARERTQQSGAAASPAQWPRPSENRPAIHPDAEVRGEL